MAQPIHAHWEKKSLENRKKYKRFLERPDKNKLLKQLPVLNDEAYERVDCLSCAACRKNYSPRFKTPDIKRISRHLKMKEGQFIDTYLRVDEDGDYVLQSKPCPFLEENNACRIYDVRPSDCARFPYTDEDVFFKRPKLTLTNAGFCPIVYVVLQRLVGEEP